jgi:DNA-directed RNA polymerase subunit RPC12/RpoP
MSLRRAQRPSVEGGRVLIAQVINEWLHLGGVQPTFRWFGGPPRVQFQGALFGMLAMQLAFTVSRTDGLATCSACGAPFIPRRRPMVGRRRYCQACGRKAAMRDAARDYRRSKSAFQN